MVFLIILSPSNDGCHISFASNSGLSLIKYSGKHISLGDSSTNFVKLQKKSISAILLKILVSSEELLLTLLNETSISPLLLNIPGLFLKHIFVK